MVARSDTGESYILGPEIVVLGGRALRANNLRKVSHSELEALAAITGETGVPGESVGRIDIKESHSLVEVHDSVARKVIQAINGTTIKGRAVRADFDRPRRGGAKRPGARP